MADGRARQLYLDDIVGALGPDRLGQNAVGDDNIAKNRVLVVFDIAHPCSAAVDRQMLKKEVGIGGGGISVGIETDAFRIDLFKRAVAHDQGIDRPGHFVFFRLGDADGLIAQVPEDAIFDPDRPRFDHRFT